MSFNIRDALAYLAIGLPTALVLTFASPANAESVTQPKAATRSVSANSSTIAVSVNNPDQWNDLSIPHELTINGVYQNSTGLNGCIEWQVEGESPNEWFMLFDEQPSGYEFSKTITVTFDASRAEHVIYFRQVDNLNDMECSVYKLPPIIYQDVRYHELQGVKSFQYNFGKPLVQKNVTCDLNPNQYELTNYQNNVNAGTASFDVVGVFPHSIGRRTYNFAITPLPLEGGLTVVSDTAFIYDWRIADEFKYYPELISDPDYQNYPYARGHRPAWKWNDERFVSLVKWKDCTVKYIDNRYPGTATIKVTGTGNFSGETFGTFQIDKAVPTIGNGIYADQEHIDITYDGEAHPVTNYHSYSTGTGDATLKYLNDQDGSISTEPPVQPGKYKVIISLTEGEYYHALEPTEFGDITIYAIDDEDYNAFMALTAELIARGATIPWDMSISRTEIPNIMPWWHGTDYTSVIFEEGKIVRLNLRDANLSGEIPKELFAFKGLKHLSIRNNKLTGNAGILAQSLPKLETLDINNNCFSEFYPAPTDNLDVAMYGQEIDKAIEVDLANLDFQQVASLIPSIMLYDRDAYDYDGNLKLELYDQSRQIGYEGTFFAYLTVNPSSNKPSFEVSSPIFMGSKDGLVTLRCAHSNSYQGHTSVHVKLKFPMGDANFNGKVEITDLQATVNYIFTPYGWNALFNYTAANMWEDDCINVQDLVTIANVLTDYHPDDDEAASPETRSRLRSIGGESGDEAHIYCADGQLIIDSPVPVAAFDAIVSGASAMTLADNLTEAGFIASIVNRDSESHIVAYSLTGAEIPAGRQTVATVTGNECRVAYAMLSDIAANAIPCIAGRRTGIDDNIAETSPTVTISGNEISLYTPTALNGCRWSIYTTSGTLLASGDCNTLPGYTTLCRVPATMTVAVAVVETPTETITTKLAVTK